MDASQVAFPSAPSNQIDRPIADALRAIPGLNISPERINQLLLNAHYPQKIGGYGEKTFFFKGVFHAIGPDFKASKLEGFDSLAVSHLMKDNLKEFITSLRQEAMTPEEDIKKLEMIYQVLETADKDCSLYSADKIKGARHLSEKVQGSMEAPLLFYGGSRGHAVIYEVTRQDNGLLSFMINNTGLGIEHHKHTHDRVQQVIYKDLKPEQLNAAFWEKLIDHKQQNEEMTPFYEFVEHHLADTTNKTEGRSIRQQRSGVCSFKSLSTWLHGQIASGHTKESRNPADEILYVKYKKFMFKQQLAEIKTNSIGSKKIAIGRQNRLMSLVIGIANSILRVVGSTKRVNGEMFTRYEVLSGQAAADYLEKSLKNKIQKMDQKIAKLHKKYPTLF
jgi:hypothetical protein